MKAGLRQSMAALHTWTGLVPGWILFIVFLFGTVAFFNEEISRWMRPELTAAPISSRALDAAGAILKDKGAGAASWNLSMPAPRDGDGFGISWIPAGGSFKDRQKLTLDPVTGAETAVRDTKGGFFLYRMHFDLHYMPVMWARYLVSIAALAMLVAILSGIVTHKKIFTDFFLLRFGKGQRSWLDAHNVTAVLALPFYLMITYTGLVTLLFTLMPWAISANFPDREAYYAEAFPSAPEVEPSGRQTAMLPFNALLRRAEQAKPGLYPSVISIRNPGDSEAVVEMYMRSDTLGGAREPLQMRATTGEIISMREPRGPAAATQQVMIDLHAGRYSGIVLRWLYFLSGVGGTVMVGSGLILWTVKRRAKLPDPTRPHVGFHLVERLNIGFIVGAPAGIAAYFLANRILPTDMADRADWEVNSLFIVWGGLFIWTIARPAKRAWSEGLAAGAALFALVPIASAITTTRGLPASLMAGDALFVSFDLVLLATAGFFAFAARKVTRHQPKSAPRRKQRALEEAMA
ncbi:PepSY domain-containing protein [Sphingobium lactosutens]|uniref:PepSY-associated TM helix domain-containing protein n=1 Tax=Sphingobium lactosutens TaxID=522773 RepID=UPI0015C1C12B|nr:PepSY-associated TM helix domain-containing protein [Sphingobium lactosutens]NWK94383.1 PepSY domain-containing protein [Sphingobium lactosutens]